MTTATMDSGLGPPEDQHQAGPPGLAEFTIGQLADQLLVHRIPAGRCAGGRGLLRTYCHTNH
jgi:hypothetical protein